MPDLTDLRNDLTGEKIRSLRKAMRLNQKQFAAQVGVSYVTLSRWECGHLRPIERHRDRIYQLAQVAYATIQEPGRMNPPDFTR